MHPNHPSVPSQARAVALQGTATSAPRNGFFPKAPGPGLIVFALFIGVLPSVFAMMVIFSRKIDAGFYLSAEFVHSQSQWVFFVAAFVSVPALIALVFVLKAVRTEARGRGPLIAVACILVGTICWDWVQAATLRSVLVPILSEDDVARIAERRRHHGVREGLFTYRVDGGVFHVDMQVAEQLDDAMLDQTLMSDIAIGPRVCVPFGHLFTGPISVVNLSLVRPDGSGRSLPVEQGWCRNWYLEHRSMDRRPRNLAPHLGG